MHKVALFGLSANPPATHHRAVAEVIARKFDQTLIIPCGPRPDKTSVNDVSASHRAAMVDLAFRGIRNTSVDLGDLEYSTFTRTFELDRVHALKGELWHVVGSDLIQGGKDGKAPIQQWYKGEDVWQRLRFVVVPRAGYPFDAADLPPHHQVIEVGKTGASSEIRELVYSRRSIDGLVPTEVKAYIERYGLYRGVPPPVSVPFDMHDPRPMVIFDRDNAASIQVARRFRAHDAAEANCIVVIGGDGTMLKAVREHWRLRLPFFGINTGHKGFTLNEVKSSVDPQAFMKDTVLFRLPLLNVEYKSTNGVWHTALAFNDAWLERATGQTARIEVSVNKVVRIPSLFADGVLVATPAGSTAYARAMGATPLPVDTPALVLVGSNVADPEGWRSKNQSLNDVIEFTVIEREKRPVKALVDGLDCGLVEAMSVRVSRAASVELISSRVDGFAHKWMSAGFPKS